MIETVAHRVPEYPRPAEDRPFASVIIVCFNQAAYLSDAIASVLRQTYPCVEILVVDDGSTDETPEIARAYPEVHYVRQENRGLASARNTGLRYSSGEYVAFLDADDRLLPHAIESGVECIRRSPECAFVFGAYRNIFSDGSPAPTDEPNPIDSDHYWNLLQSNFIGMHAAVLYRAARLEKIGGFDERLAACEDYDLYLRAAREYPVHRHGAVVAEYRQHDTNMSKDHAFMLTSVVHVLRMQRACVPDRRHRKALRRGLEIWREYYGALLLEKWKEDRSLRGLVRMFGLNPRGMLRRAARAALGRMRAAIRRGSIDFGSLRRREPFSRCFGFDRGLPIDRYYVESFLESNAEHIQGRVLEIGDDAYSRRFGAEKITRQDVLHIAPGQPGVTITADLADAPHIPDCSFDCIILTQTLQYVFDLRSAVATLHRILKPGGWILATLPGISQVCRDQDDKSSDCWRFTDASARKLFSEAFGAANVRVGTHGNVLAAMAFLQGLCVKDLAPGDLEHRDPDYQLTVTVSAWKEGETPCFGIAAVLET